MSSSGLWGHLNSGWRFRSFIWTSIQGDFRNQFASSKIGWLWSVFHPMAMATIYALVLSKILGARFGDVENEAAYAIFLMAGLAAWTLFNEIATRCLNIFIEYGNALKKISFPRIALPAIILGNALINQFLLVASIAFVFAFFGNYPNVTWVLLPVGMLVAVALAFGLGILLGVFNVFVRDVGQFMVVVFQIWFWLTPIIYPSSILGEEMQVFINFNPMTPVVAWFQDIMLYHRWPDPVTLIYPAALAVFLNLLALMVFRRASPEIVDVL